MQNKYKLPSDVRKTVIGLVQGYNRRKREIQKQEEEICAVGSAKYETIQSSDDWENAERVYLPTGKGGVSSPVETQAIALINLHKSFDYRCNQSIDEALRELTLDSCNKDISERIKKTIIVSCEEGKKFKFYRSGVIGISESTFYRLRHQFLYSVAKKLDFF